MSKLATSASKRCCKYQPGKSALRSLSSVSASGSKGPKPILGSLVRRRCRPWLLRRGRGGGSGDGEGESSSGGGGLGGGGLGGGDGSGSDPSEGGDASLPGWNSVPDESPDGGPEGDPADPDDDPEDSDDPGDEDPFEEPDEPDAGNEDEAGRDKLLRELGEEGE